ncbi:hypothetical protein [Streptomyces sp. NBC_00847]|uniref:hypothetical protein n=1 Tax=unclassified Streptomyces TaxID=2593676 RepID=UPI002B1DB715|nr:hypothetical protein [Streptomyces sp. NBC_00847]
MPVRRRTVAAVAALGVVPLALTRLASAPASAHGRTGDPVSRVSQSASAPSDEQIAEGAGKPAVEHHGHGDAGASTSTAATTVAAADEPRAAGSSEALAETGGDDSASYIAVGGAAGNSGRRQGR